MRWSLTPWVARSGFCSCILSRITPGSCARSTIEVTNTAAARLVKIQVRTQAHTRVAGRERGAAATGSPYLEVGGGVQVAGARSDRPAPGCDVGWADCGDPEEVDDPGSKGGGQTGRVAGWVAWAGCAPEDTTFSSNQIRAGPSHRVPTAAATADEM